MSYDYEERVECSWWGKVVYVYKWMSFFFDDMDGCICCCSVKGFFNGIFYSNRVFVGSCFDWREYVFSRDDI